MMNTDLASQPTEGIHIGHLIQNVLTDQRYSAAWLAKQLYCDRTNVYKIFHKASIDCELLLEISIVLNYDFFKIYSKLVANSHSGNEQ